MKLTGYEEITGVLECREGLKIGGTKEAAGIGETDNPVIRHPVTHLPYIPGSSLKGKIRSLMESRICDSTQKDGYPCSCGTCEVCQLFGSNNVKTTYSPTRLIFRDAPLTSESEDKLTEALPGSFVEEKTEIAMDRSTGKTRDRSLRQIERVPAGARFQFSFTMRLFAEDAAQHRKFWTLIAQAIDDLEMEYLGGCGTRGCGQVRLLAPDGVTRLADVLRQKAKS